MLNFSSSIRESVCLVKWNKTSEHMIASLLLKIWVVLFIRVNSSCSVQLTCKFDTLYSSLGHEMAGQRKCNWKNLTFLSIIAYVSCHSGFKKQETELERWYSSIRPVCKYSREDWAGFWLVPLHLCKSNGFASALLSDLQGTYVSENMFQNVPFSQQCWACWKRILLPCKPCPADIPGPWHLQQCHYFNW